MHELGHRLDQEHMSLEEYAEMSNRTVDDIRNEQQLLARDMVRRSLILQEIARRENLYVTEEDINAAITGAVGDPKQVKTLRKELEKSGRLNSLVSRIFHEKVLSFLENNANIEIEGEVTPAEPTPETPETPVEDAE